MKFDKQMLEAADPNVNRKRTIFNKDFDQLGAEKQISKHEDSEVQSNKEGDEEGLEFMSSINT